jgi:hypothetical protein
LMFSHVFVDETFATDTPFKQTNFIAPISIIQSM